MKKIFGILSVFVLAIALTACGGKAEKAPAPSPVAQPSAEAPAPTPTAPATEGEGVFASVRDAMEKSIPMKCTDIEVEGVKTTMYFKGSLVRMDTEKTAAMPATHEVVKGTMLYMWSEGMPSGISMDLSKSKPGEDAPAGEAPAPSSDDLVSRVNGQEKNCAKADIPDSTFDVPTSIKFVNTSL